MNYISELAYASHIAQTSKSAKDKKQKNTYQQSELPAGDFIDDLDADTSIFIEQVNSTTWQGEERRTGQDRREAFLNRGRYFESRSTQSRRYSDESHSKIQLSC